MIFVLDFVGLSFVFGGKGDEGRFGAGGRGMGFGGFSEYFGWLLNDVCYLRQENWSVVSVVWGGRAGRWFL